MSQPNRKQEEILVQVADILTATQGLLAKVAATLAAQTQAITHSATKRGLLISQVAATVLLAAIIGFGTWQNNETSKDTRRVGEQNNLTVSVFCKANGSLPECTLPGSATAKATAILTICRTYANIPTAGFAAHLETDAGCSALGFVRKAQL